jgi:hypothetical protein
MRQMSKSVVAAAVGLVVAGLSTLVHAVPTVDGTRDAEYGAALSVQTQGTQFGNATNGNPIQALGGSEVNASYSVIANGRLHVFISGNLESNYNKLELFVDSIAGGQNQLRGDNSGIDFGGLNRMGSDGTNPGLKFDAGFDADYFITLTNGDSDGGVQYFSNAAELLTDGRGNGDFVGGSGVLSPLTATNAVITGTGGFGNGLVIGANNSNTLGVDGAGPTSDPAAVATGFEFSIPLEMIGNPSGPIRVIAAINGGGHDFLSNQFLGALPAGSGNLGEPRLVDLSLLGGDQFFTAASSAPQVRFNATTGNYSNPSNYTTGAVPNADTAIVTFNAGAAQAVNLDQDTTLNYVEFDGPGTTISGVNTLTLAGSSRRAVRALAGTHVISAPVIVNKDAAYEIATGASVAIANFDNTGKYVDKVGGGTLAVNKVTGSGIDLRGGTLKLTGTRNAAGTSNVTQLFISDGTTLDLGVAGLIFDYGDTNIPSLATLTAWITSGKITSAGIPANQAIGFVDTSLSPSLTSFRDIPLDATAVAFAATLKGDTDLNGSVNFNDLLALAQNYNGTSRSWFQGDFDYTGTVDFNDLLSLAQNYNGTLSLEGETFSADFAADFALAMSLVPEPTTLAAVGGLACTMLRRRRAV